MLGILGQKGRGIGYTVAKCITVTPNTNAKRIAKNLYEVSVGFVIQEIILFGRPGIFLVNVRKEWKK
jgi:hypothetical protein